LTDKPPDEADNLGEALKLVSSAGTNAGIMVGCVCGLALANSVLVPVDLIVGSVALLVLTLLRLLSLRDKRKLGLIPLRLSPLDPGVQVSGRRRLGFRLGGAEPALLLLLLLQLAEASVTVSDLAVCTTGLSLYSGTGSSISGPNVIFSRGTEPNEVGTSISFWVVSRNGLCRSALIALLNNLLALDLMPVLLIITATEFFLFDPGRFALTFLWKSALGFKANPPTSGCTLAMCILCGRTDLGWKTAGGNIWSPPSGWSYNAR
jgi:hypothetical protein